MKAIVVAAGSLVVVLGILVYEESRIASLKRELADAKEGAAAANSRRVAGGGDRIAPAAAGSGAEGSKSARRGSRPAAVAGSGGRDQRAEEPQDDNLTEMFRQMLDNPVGAAMLREENKGKALALYGGFIDALSLNQEERDYFVDLLAAGVNEEQMIGMKMLSAQSDDERNAILDQMETDQAARRQAIREFLNNSEDFAKYEHLEERKEIYQQMPGLRAAMQETGASMSGEQEERIVNAIYQASVSSGMHATWDGRAGMEQMARPGVTERFKEQWGEMQNVLEPNVGAIFETPEQQAAFREHQTLVGNMVGSNLQFVEGMIRGAGPGQEEGAGEDAPAAPSAPAPAQ